MEITYGLSLLDWLNEISLPNWISTLPASHDRESTYSFKQLPQSDFIFRLYIPEYSEEN